MTEQSKIRTHLLRLGIVAGVVVLLFFLMIGLVIWQPAWFLPYALKLFSLSGDEITTGEVHIGLSPPRIEANHVIIRDVTGMDIEMTHLVAEPDVLDWWQGDAWLDLLEVDGLRLSLGPQPQSDSKPLDLSLLNYLLFTRDIRVTRTTLTLALGEYLVDVESLALSITPIDDRQREMRISGSFQVRGPDHQSVLTGQLRGLGRIEPPVGLTCQVDLQDVQAGLPWVQGPLHMESSILLEQNAMTMSQLKLVIPPGSLKPFPDTDTSRIDLNLLASAEISLIDTAWQLDMNNLTIGSFIEAQGNLAGQGPELTTGRLSGLVMETDSLWEVLKSSLPNAPRDLAIQGPLPFMVDLQGRGANQILKINLTPEKVTAETSGLKVHLTGTSEISGPPAGPWTLGGRLQVEGAYKKDLFDVESFTLKAPLAGYLNTPRMDGWELNIDENLVSYNSHPLPLGKVTARGDFLTQTEGPALEQVSIEFAALGLMTGSAGITDHGIRADFTGQGLDVAALSPLAGVPTGLPVEAWQTGGHVDLRVTMSPGQTVQEISIQADLADMVFQNPEATIMGQKVNGKISFQTAFGPDAPMNMDLQLTQGEALLDTVYLQFKQNPVRISTRGMPRPEGGFKDIRIQGSWGKMGKLLAFGTVWPSTSGWNWRGRAEVSQAELKPIFDTFVRLPLAASYPTVETMSLAGRADLKFKIAGSNTSSSVNGELRLDEVFLSQGEQPPLLENMDLLLPFSYVFGSTAKTKSVQDQAVEQGRLEIGKLRLGRIDIGPLKLPIRLAANRLDLDGEIRLPVWGGTTTLSGIYVDQPLSPAFIAHLGLKLDRLDLSQMPSGRIKLEGHLEGRNLAMTAATDRLRVEGSLQGQAFDGKLSLENISVLHPFGSGRELKLDLKAEQVNLEKMSQALKVGRITGLVDMNLTGLSVARNLPIAFHLILKSIPQAELKRTISLQAVNSISVVGTGAGLTGVGVSLFKGFFETLPYREIGIECILKNDVFAVRGLIQEEGIEYLVKRPTFMGVNVINGNPNNRIGFSEMLNRIQRVVDNPSQ